MIPFMRAGMMQNRYIWVMRGGIGVENSLARGITLGKDAHGLTPNNEKINEAKRYDRRERSNPCTAACRSALGKLATE